MTTTSTRTRTSPVVKLGAGILIVGALAFGVSLALGLIALPRRGWPGVTPLRPNRIESGAPNTLWDRVDVRLTFSRDGITLASYALPTGQFTSYGQAASMGKLGIPTAHAQVTDFTIAPIPGNDPLRLTVGGDSQQAIPPTIVPARIFVIQANTGFYALCFPETTASANMSSYYYSADGTPYHDKGLRNRATSQTCSQFLAAGYRPSDLTNASLNAFYHGVHLAFSRTADPAARLGLLNQRNEWTDGSANHDFFATSPLAVQVFVPEDLQNDSPDNPDSLSLPARTLTVTADGNQATLCLPEDTLTIRPEWETVTYYYGADGTPYHDAFLQNRAMTETCRQALATAFTPRVITSARLNQAYTTPRQGFNPTLNFFREATALYHLDGVTNTGEPESTIATTNQGQSPLGMYQDTHIEPAITWGARAVTVVADGQTKQLCWPETQSDATAMFFYDTDGKPYRDSLLQQLVACTLPGRAAPSQEVAP